MRRHPSLLPSLCFGLFFAHLCLGGLGCGKKRTAPPSPAVTTLPAERPLDPLLKRTGTIEADDSRVYLGTSGGLVSKPLLDPKKEASEPLMLPGSVATLAWVGPHRLAAGLGPTGLALVETGVAAGGDAGSGSSQGLRLLNRVPWSREAAHACHSVWSVVPVTETMIGVACGTGGVTLLDIGDPTDPRVVGVHRTRGYVRDLALLSNLSAEPQRVRVVAADGLRGLVVVEFGPDQTSTEIATLDTGGDARAVALQQRLVYVANGGAGLAIVDLSDATQPKVVGHFDPDATDKARDVSVLGTKVLLSMGESGLRVLDVSSPASPRQLDAWDPPHCVNRVVVRDQTVLVANDTAGLTRLQIEPSGRISQLRE